MFSKPEVKEVRKYEFKANEAYCFKTFDGFIFDDDGEEFILFTGAEIPTFAVLPIKEVELIKKIPVYNIREINRFECFLSEYRRSKIR